VNIRFSGRLSLIWQEASLICRFKFPDTVQLIPCFPA
jgi:hypothetical protein